MSVFTILSAPLLDNSLRDYSTILRVTCQVIFL
nr:MAG TPA: hypothetical protein [Caudoviricetes sp.]